MYVSLWISWVCGTWFGLFCFTDSKLTWSHQMMTKIFWCVSQCEKEELDDKLSKLAAVDCWHCGQWGFVLSHMPRHGHQVLDISSCKCLFVCLRVLNHYYFIVLSPAAISLSTQWLPESPRLDKNMHQKHCIFSTHEKEHKAWWVSSMPGIALLSFHFIQHGG